MPRLYNPENLFGGGIMSFGKLRSFLGLSNHFDFLSQLAFSDKCVMREEFDGDAANTIRFLETQISGGGTVTYPSAANGILRVTTGSAGAADGMVIAGNLIWMGDLNVIAETRVRANIVTTLNVEFGFGDLAARNTEIVDSYNTPTLNTDQADVVVAVVDTGGTNGGRWKLVTDGSTSNMNATGTQSGEAFGSVAATPTTAGADVYDKIQLTITGNRGRMYRNGKSLAHHGDVLASQVEGGTLVAPYLCGFTLTTADKLIDFDYLYVAQDRT